MRNQSVVSLILTAILMTAAFSASADDAIGQRYSDAAFAKAQSQNQPILVDVSADWCPTCARQHEVLRALLASGRYDDLRVFTVDFDSQKPAVKRFKAPRQSTLVMYRGTQETDRAIAITSQQAIRSLLDSAYPERAGTPD